MSDLINRQDAINAMMALQAEDDEAYGCHIPEGFDGERAIEALEQLPSAQPKLHGVCMDCLMKNVCRFKRGLSDYGYCSQWKGAEYG